MCVTFCLYVWTCTTCMQHLQRPEAGNRFPESGVKNGCEQPYRCWEPQQKQQGSLTVELSFQLWILTSYSLYRPHVANGNIKLPALRLQTLTTRPDLWADWPFCFERGTLLLSDVYLASHHVRRTTNCHHDVICQQDPYRRADRWIVQFIISLNWKHWSQWPLTGSRRGLSNSNSGGWLQISFISNLIFTLWRMVITWWL